VLVIAAGDVVAGLELGWAGDVDVDDRVTDIRRVLLEVVEHQLDVALLLIRP
jgi:hypothetical protein